MDDMIARELLKIASMLVEARVDLQSRFNHWNRTAFDGRLPHIPVRWGRSRVWAGVCKGTLNRSNGTGSVDSIDISDYIVDDPAIIDGVLLHEMIHALMYLGGKGGHGYEFEALRREYASKTGVEIKREESLSNFAPPEDLEVTPKGVMVMEASGRKSVVVYNLNFFKRSLDAIKSYSEALAAYYRTRGSKMKATFLISKAKDLWKYPEKRSVTQGSYPVSDSLLDELLRNGQTLAEVVA